VKADDLRDALYDLNSNARPNGDRTAKFPDVLADIEACNDRIEESIKSIDAIIKDQSFAEMVASSAPKERRVAYLLIAQRNAVVLGISSLYAQQLAQNNDKFLDLVAKMDAVNDKAQKAQSAHSMTSQRGYRLWLRSLKHSAER
jgi:hypothetical protein